MSAPTIVDVARSAKVGLGTVSRVINNAPFVAEETALAVRRAMQELGYEPPPPERRRGRRMKKNPPGPDADLLFLILGPQGLRWILDCAPVYSYVMDGLESAVSRLGKNLIVRQIHDWNALSGVLEQRQTQGAIILGAREPEGPLPPTLQRFPLVWVMGSPMLFHGDHVQPDHMRIGLLAAEHLLGRGHRCCAFLGVKPASPDFQLGLRGDAFAWAIVQAGGTVHQLLDERITIVSGDMNTPNEPVINKLLDQMLALRPRPTALFIHADMYTPVVYRHLIEKKVMPQKDIAIVTCNNERPYLVGLRPAPTVIDLQADVIAQRAVDQLLLRVQRPAEPPNRILVAPKLLAPAAESV